MLVISWLIRSTISVKNLTLIPIFSLLTLLGGCASTQMASPTLDSQAKTFTPAPGQANIYAYRQGIVARALLLQVVIDGHSGGLLAPDTFQVITVPPGPHTVAITAAPHMPVSVTESSQNILAEAGRNYFFRVSVHMGLTASHPKLEIVSQEKGIREVKSSNLAETTADQQERARQFAEGWSKLQQGMSAAQVNALLGKSFIIDPQIIDNAIKAGLVPQSFQLGMNTLVFGRNGLESWSPVSPDRSIASAQQSNQPAETQNPEAVAYPIRATVTLTEGSNQTATLSWVSTNQSRLKDARVLVDNIKTGQGQDIALPEAPPLDLGQLSPGDYQVWIYTPDFGHGPEVRAQQISNKENFTIK